MPSALHRYLLITLSLAAVSGLALRLATAQDTQPAGKLSVGGKEYSLRHFVAYEALDGDDKIVAVLASDRPFNVAEIKANLKENDGDDDDLSLAQLHVRVRFDKDGKPTGSSLKTRTLSSSTSGDRLTGELKAADGRAIGKAKLALEGDGDFASSFEFEFRVGILGTAAEEAQKADPLAKLGVTGDFKGNGKNAKIAFVSARPGDEFSGKPSIDLIFTELDHTKDPKAGFNATFGKYGSAIEISCHEDGSVFSCQVSHAGHKQRGFSSVGSIELTDFQIARGQVQGTLTTSGQVETFGDTWDVNLKFAAPYKSQVAVSEAKPTGDKPASDKPKTASNKPEPTEPKPTQPKESLKATDLALPKGAADVNYKAIVEMLDFKCPGDVKSVADEFSKNLAAQGWEKEAGDLVNPRTAILRRKKGEATLTIFVKPADGGTTVNLHTDGLDWDE